MALELHNAMFNSPIGKEQLKNSLRKVIAQQLYNQEYQLTKLALQLPMLKPSKGMEPNLQFGYKIMSKQMLEKEKSGEIPKQKITILNKKMLEANTPVEKAGEAI